MGCSRGGEGAIASAGLVAFGNAGVGEGFVNVSESRLRSSSEKEVWTLENSWSQDKK